MGCVRAVAPWDACVAEEEWGDDDDAEGNAMDMKDMKARRAYISDAVLHHLNYPEN